jgi:hypothetical protein
LVAEEFLCSFVDYKNSRMFGNLPSDENLSASFPLVIEELVSIFSFGH